MHFGLSVQMTGTLGTPASLIRLAREAETSGGDGFFIFDVMVSGDVPFNEAGYFPGVLVSAVPLRQISSGQPGQLT